MAYSISRSVEGFNKQRSNNFKIDSHDLLREYLTFGKARFEELWERERGKVLKREEHAQAAVHTAEKQRRIDLAADKLIAQCVYASLSHVQMSSALRKQSEGALIDTIMDAIMSVVQAHAGGRLTLRGSYMTYVTDTSMLPALRMRALFTRGMLDSYSGYLELRRGGGWPVRQVVLPVASNSTAILPGAPEAVNVVGPAVMNIRAISFRDGVAAEVRREIEKYFRDPYFDPMTSVTSLVTYDGGTVHGVMNIESSAPDLLGEDAEATPAMLARLQTLVALLSIFH